MPNNLSRPPDPNQIGPPDQRPPHYKGAIAIMLTTAMVIIMVTLALAAIEHPHVIPLIQGIFQELGPMIVSGVVGYSIGKHQQ